MKLIFMGTPDFAVPTLEALIESRHQVVAVYTQPDRESGRGKKILQSPVKECALRHQIPVYQPKGLRKQEIVEEMRSLGADAIIVVAYGIILREPVLKMTKYGCFNVHGSLLPKYRGAAPIQWAVLNGETESGVTIMQMDEGIDTGDILAVKKVPVLPDETGDSLFEKLSLLGGPLLLSVLEDAERGELHPVKQGEATTPYASMLDKSMGDLDFRKDAVLLERYVRGLNSWPSAYCRLRGRMIKIWQAEVTEEVAGTPGEITAVGKNDFTICCGKGGLKVLSLQPEGKKRMDTGAFLRGCPLRAGERMELPDNKDAEI